MWIKLAYSIVCLRPLSENVCSLHARSADSFETPRISVASSAFLALLWRLTEILLSRNFCSFFYRLNLIVKEIEIPPYYVLLCDFSYKWNLAHFGLYSLNLPFNHRTLSASINKRTTCWKSIETCQFWVFQVFFIHFFFVF